MIITQGDLPELRHKMRDSKLVFTCGTFDLIHPGHIEFLEWCAQQGDKLFVSINSDAQVRNVKGINRPVLSQDDRLAMLNALSMVDYVYVKETVGELAEVSISSARDLKPDVAVLGYDWAEREIDLWRNSLPNTQILVAPMRKAGRSTSTIINAIIDTYGDNSEVSS